MAVGDSFLKMLEGIDGYYDSDFPNDPFVNWEQITQKYELQPNEFTNTVELIPQANVIRNADGSIRSYDVSAMIENAPETAESINSNANTQQISSVEVPSNTTIDSQTGAVEATTGAVTAGGGVASVVSMKDKIIPALVAAGVLITVGKTVTPDLYDALPNIFKDSEMEQFDPETWEKITQERTRDGQSDPSYSIYSLFKSNGDGTGTAYVDEEAMAYMIRYLTDKGAFNTGTIISGMVAGAYITQPLSLIPTYYYEVMEVPDHPELDTVSESTVSDSHIRIVNVGNGSCIAVSDRAGRIMTDIRYRESGQTITQFNFDLVQKTVNGQTFYYADGTFGNDGSNISELQYNVCRALGWSETNANLHLATGYAVMFGEEETYGGIEGIGQQPNVNTPNFRTTDTPEEVITKIKTAFPDLADDELTETVVQEDGTVVIYKYIPVVLPVENPQPTDEDEPETQPVSGTQTAENTKVEEETSPETVVKYVVKVVTETPTKTDEEVGSGDTPVVTPPTGTASALYTVYNPSQSEINSFGSWLWSANFVDQILKMFNDPMQAIISLHKVFCSPSVSGRDNITVGYLDSGVESNVVSGQYVEVDCGSVSLLESFQNVFDYPPFTEVSLYLPFIGFVKLDVNDIMRSTISVKYTVDVLTGACLAEVNVVRDMFGGVLYQFSGDCSVHYPLSSGSYMGIVSALLGVAGTVASGGALAPMVIGSVAGISKGKTSVERSGSLSGNAGAMGIKKPYLVIQRPQTNMPVDFETFLGKPSYSKVKISECTGFIKCTEVHALNTPATESELNELVSLLKEGVIL